MPEPKRNDTSGKESAENSFQITAPAITMPKGGGAIRGMGEKFAANPVTGTGSMTIPIATSPGRSGFGPQLSLSYDSGAGNGPFGLGWHLSLPSVTRKTDKGLPKYQDAIESDVFILSGAEDLVPVLIQNAGGQWEPEIIPSRIVNGTTYCIKRYRPRIEGLFARIERWTNQVDPKDTFWRSISKDNITTWYGKSDNSRMADPSDTSRVFSWLICQSYDDKGNAIRYEYKGEDSQRIFEDQQGQFVALAHERNRTDDTRIANRYLKRISYGNCEPYLPKLEPGKAWPDPPSPGLPGGKPNWLFEVVFDYDDGHYAEDAPDSHGGVFARPVYSPLNTARWKARVDPFSTYRAGFEVRTYRLCQRVLMFHHFPELGTNDCLVRATHFTYKQAPIASFITSATQSGYIRQSDGTYLKKSLPPVECEYSEATIDERVREVDAASLENLPQGLDGSAYQWVDLDGEGLSGILTEQAGAWFYKRNQSALPIADKSGKFVTVARFSPLETLATMPSPARLSGGQQLMDLAGDGQLDVVEFDGPIPGFFERTPEDEWDTLTAFTSLPNIAWKDPHLKFIDLTGDGHVDILITEDDAFSWYPSLAEAGFGPGENVRQAIDEEQGPRLVFADGTQSIYLADMSGDGLTDLVRIRNADVCYWPNVGYGRFGTKVTMGNAPLFDYPDQFDQRRIRLADIDGSGVVDMLYLSGTGVHLYFNQSGNTWSARRTLNTFPRIDNLSSVTTVDLLGNGTACLVWSSPLPGDARSPMRYIDLMGGNKPHLLVKTWNSLGAETEVSYVPSTKFYLADRLAGQPWITRLPFPVYCVEKVTVRDKWRQTKFSSTYSYHHGYFDGVEREFRGFGRVEQVDTESYGKFLQGNITSPYITDDQTLYQPPMKSVTWYHTGFASERERILGAFEHEYHVIPGFTEHKLPQPTLPSDALTADEWREAARACKGMVLRQEVFELDVDALVSGEQRPVKLFSTAYHNNNIQRSQPQGPNRHAVFLVTESEAITYNYELALPKGGSSVKPDPRIAHTLNMKIDAYGNVLESAAAVYPRIGVHDDLSLSASQLALIHRVQSQERHLALNCTRYTDDIIEPDAYRLRLPCQTQAWEVTGVTPTGDYFTLSELKGKNLVGSGANEIAYHEVSDGTTPQKRLIECARTLFFAGDLQNHRALGEQGALALPYESYKLALTNDLLDRVLVDPARLDPAYTALNAQATNGYPISGYYKGDQLFPNDPITPTPLTEQYWMASGRAGFNTDAAQHFYLPERYTDPFGNPTMLVYDLKYDLFIRSSTDALGNHTGIFDDRNNPNVGLRFDYRTLAPAEMEDVNGNRTEVYFDALGMVVAMAVKGKGAEADNLNDYTDVRANPSLAEVLNHFDLPPLTATQARNKFSPLLGNATTRFLYHFGEKIEDGQTVWASRPAGACAIVREQHGASLAIGDLPSPLQIAFECSDGMGAVLMKRNQAEPETTGGNLRWIVNGKTVLNNKGKPVKQYEPYFSSKASCCAEGDEHEEVGVTPIMYYDSAGRLIRTEMPDGTLSRVEFTPWLVKTFDANDTVLEKECAWYQKNGRNRFAPDRPLPTDLTTGLPTATPDERAGWLAAQHANTPAQVHLDSLGREVLAIAHNRTNGVDEKYTTFTKLDAEGKPLWIRDARGNLVMQYITPAKMNTDPSNAMPSGSVPCYDIAGNLLFQYSMDAGDRWMLMDAAGKPMLAWDFNKWQDQNGVDQDVENRIYSTEYDALHRQTHQWRVINSQPRKLVDYTKYGESLGDAVAKQRNLRGQAHLHYDPSGLSQIEGLDFKGKPLEVKRTLTNMYDAPVLDWNVADRTTLLETETFSQITEYDALGRMTTLYNWHQGIGSRVAVYMSAYNERGLMLSETLDVGATKKSIGHTPSGKPLTSAIDEIRYNVKGQKEYLKLGNGTVTRYTYDLENFRLRLLYSRRNARFTDDCGGEPPPPRTAAPDTDSPPRPCGVQNLKYTYDPVGNTTHIQDDAQDTIWFANRQVEPSNDYTYDALYRLIVATGRENSSAPAPPPHPEGNWPLSPKPSPNAVNRYTQQYRYDNVGNFLRMEHKAARGPGQGNGDWTRQYQPSDYSNRLARTWYGTADWDNTATDQRTVYRHDLHGSMLNLANTAPGLDIRWDWRDMICTLDLQGGGDAFYNYGIDKQRTRKRIVHNGSVIEDRIYLGGYELYRRYNGASSTIPVEVIESLHLFEGDQRVLLVDDVIKTDRKHAVGTKFKTGPIFRYQYSNHLGSACLELDDQAEVISYEEYHPYGTSAYRAMKNGIEASPKRYRYTGMERDEESGLSYHATRYCAAWLGRWTSCDPVGVADGLQVYAYVHLNPVRHVDPLGTFGFDQADEYKDLSPPPLIGAPVSPMNPQTFMRFHGLMDGEIYQRTGELVWFGIDTDFKTNKALETGSFWKGRWYPDTVRTWRPPFSIESVEVPATYQFREGFFYQVEGRPELELLQELDNARSKHYEERIQQYGDRPTQPSKGDIAGALHADYLLNFDKPTRSVRPPSKYSLDETNLPGARAWSFVLDPKKTGSTHYVGPQSSALGLGIDAPTSIHSSTNLNERILRAEPGVVSLGYSYLNRDDAGTMSFALGAGSLSTVPYFPNGASQPTFPIRVPGSPPSPPSSSGFYLGARLSFDW